MIWRRSRELIGVNMRALLALTTESTLYSCPFAVPWRKYRRIRSSRARPHLPRSTSRVHGAAGEGLQTIHVLKDISDRREAERRYRELFDNIQEACFSAPRKAASSKSTTHWWPCWDMPAAKNFCRWISHPGLFLPRSAPAPQPAMEEHGHMRNFEATLRRKKRLSIYVLINAFGMYDSLGRLVQIRGLMLDVTGLHTYQSELQRERDFFRQNPHNTPNLILVSDMQVSSATPTAAGMKPVSNSGTLRPTSARVGCTGYVRHFRTPCRPSCAADKSTISNCKSCAATPRRTVLRQPQSMRDEQNNINSIVVVMTDITDSAELSRQTRPRRKNGRCRTTRLRVAHEVNNPLTAILGFADLLLDNPTFRNCPQRSRVILQKRSAPTDRTNLLSFARQMPRSVTLCSST